MKNKQTNKQTRYALHEVNRINIEVYSNHDVAGFNLF